MNMDYKEIEGGVYENTGADVQEIADDIVDDLREDWFENGAGGSISDDDEIIPIDFDGLMESIANAVQNADTIHKKEAEHIVPEILQGNIVENLKEKTNEFFHEICDMNPSEIEDTVKCHVQVTKGGLRPPEGVAAAGGDPASIAQMYILRACRGIPLSPYAACGRKIGGGAAGRSVSNEKINL